MVRNSPRCRAALQRAASAISRDFAAAEAAAAFLGALRPIHDFCAAWDPTQIPHGTRRAVRHKADKLAEITMLCSPTCHVRAKETSSRRYFKIRGICRCGCGCGMNGVIGAGRRGCHHGLDEVDCRLSSEAVSIHISSGCHTKWQSATAAYMQQEMFGHTFTFKWTSSHRCQHTQLETLILLQ